MSPVRSSPCIPSQLDEYCKALEASKSGSTEEAAAAAASLRAKGKPMVAALELQRLFARLQGLDQRSISTEALTRYGFEWFSSEGGVQHDVQELNRLLYDKVEKQLKNTSGRNIIPSLYKFPIAYRKTFLAPQLGITEASQQPGYDLSVIVQGNPDLAHALAASITPEYFSGLEAPNGERCAAVRGVELEELPPVLVISLNRSGFNPATYDPIKVEDRCAFPLALDMRPFVAGGEVAQATRADVLRSNGVAVNTDGTPLPAGTDPAAEAPPSVTAAIQRASDTSVWLHDDLTSDAMAARSLKAAVPAPGAEQLYDLFAVVIHAGSAHGGHYTAYIRDVLEQGNWSVPESALSPERSDTKGGSRGGGSSSGGGGLSGQDKAKVQFEAATDPHSPLRMLLDIMATQPVHREHGVPFISMSDLGVSISANMKKSWSKTYKKKWGALKAFLVANDNHFSMLGADTVLLVPNGKAPATAKAVAPVGAVTAPVSSPSDATGGGWTKVVSGKQPAVVAGPQSEAAKNAEQEAEHAESARRQAERAKQERTAELWGHWFLFNDSTVVPIAVKDIEKQFQGRESGYILMYRARELSKGVTGGPIPTGTGQAAAEATPSADTADASGDASFIDPAAGAAFIEAVPGQFAAEVQAENAEVGKKRFEYDTAAHTISVFVHPAGLYSKSEDDPRLKFNVEAAAALKATHGSGDELVTAAQSDLPAAGDGAVPGENGIPADVSAEDAAAIAAAMTDAKEEEAKGVKGVKGGKEDEEDDTGPTPEELEKQADEDWRTAGLAVTVDTRWTVRRFLQELAAKVPAELWPAGTKGVQGDCTDVSLHLAQRMAGGVHLYEGVVEEGTQDATPNLPEGVSHSDVAASDLLNPLDRPLTDFPGVVMHRGVLLLWAGGAVDGVPVRSGLAYQPLSLMAHYFREETDTEEGGEGGLNVACDTIDLVTTRDVTLGELKAMLMAKFSEGGVSMDLPPPDLGMWQLTTSSTGNVRATQLDKPTAMEQLKTPGAPVSATHSQTLGQAGVDHGSEIALEPLNDALGKKRFTPLASSEAKRRTANLNFKVRVSPDVPRPPVLLAAVAAGQTEGISDSVQAAISAGIAEEPFEISFSVDRSTTVQILKRRILRRLGWTEQAPLSLEEVEVHGSSEAAAEQLATKPAPGAVKASARGPATAFDRLGAETRCRRTHNGTPAALVADECDQMYAAGVYEGSVLVLEAGRPLGSAEVALRYAVVVGNAHTPDGAGGRQGLSKEVVIGRNVSATQLKRTILALEGMGPSEVEAVLGNRRLRKTNFADELQGIMLNEGQSLSKHNVHTGDLIICEEGPVPKAGQVILSLAVWTPEHAAAIHAMQPQAPPASPDGGGSYDASQCLPALEGEPPMDAWEWAVRARSACLWPVSDVTFTKERTIADLKTHILGMRDVAHARAVAQLAAEGGAGGFVFDPKGAKARAAFAADEADAAASRKHQSENEGSSPPPSIPVGPALTRAASAASAKSTPDGVPAVQDVPTLAELGLTASHLRLREVTPVKWPGKVLKPNSKTIARSGIGSGKQFVVEVLTEEESLNDKDLVLWLQHRQQTGPGAMQNTPSWPPVSFVWHPPDSAQLADLQVALATVACQLTGRPCLPVASEDESHFQPEDIAVAKWWPSARSRVLDEGAAVLWMNITAKMGASGGGGKPGKGGRGKRRGNLKPVKGGLLKNPVMLKDGDLLAFQVVQGGSVAGVDDWLRTEDETLVAREHARVVALRAERRYGGKGGRGGRSRGPEAILSLGGDDSDEYGEWGDEEEQEEAEDAADAAGQ